MHPGSPFQPSVVSRCNVELTPALAAVSRKLYRFRIPARLRPAVGAQRSASRIPRPGAVSPALPWRCCHGDVAMVTLPGQPPPDSVHPPGRP